MNERTPITRAALDAAHLAALDKVREMYDGLATACGLAARQRDDVPTTLTPSGSLRLSDREMKALGLWDTSRDVPSSPHAGDDDVEAFALAMKGGYSVHGKGLLHNLAAAGLASEAFRAVVAREVEAATTPLRAKLEAVRAGAVTLPEVGEVTRDGDMLLVGAYKLYAIDSVLAESEDYHARSLARVRAGRAHLAELERVDAVQSTPTTDDEVDAEFAELDAALFGTEDGGVLDDRAELPVGAVRGLLREHLIAHRRAAATKGGA